jgi:hypothetical protein
MFRIVNIKLIVAATLLAFVLLPLAGCKDDETRHLIYIEPDGSVTWRTIEDLVRSDEDDPRKRLAEEEKWVDKTLDHEEGWSAIMQGLGAREIQQWFLRDTRPYTVVTEATFDDMRDVVERADVYCEADENQTTLERDGDRWTLTTTVETTDETWKYIADAAGHVWILTMLESRIVASQGRFIEAEGFELSNDGVIATPLPLTDDEIAEQPKQVVYSLTWDTTA